MNPAKLLVVLGLAAVLACVGLTQLPDPGPTTVANGVVTVTTVSMDDVPADARPPVDAPADLP